MEKINGISRAVKPGTVVAIPRQGDVTPNLVAAGAFGHGTQIQVCSPEAGGEVSATVSLGAGANGFPVATLSEAQRLLACATTIGEIQKVESLAQLAVEFAKRARLGRAAINAAARIALDARRKAGDTLKRMSERGELAGPGKPKMSHGATLHTLVDLGVTRSQSSLYQQEASVPADVYEAWVRRVVESKDRVLSAQGPSCLGAAMRRIRRARRSAALFRRRRRPNSTVACQTRETVGRRRQGAPAGTSPIAVRRVRSGVRWSIVKKVGQCAPKGGLQCGNRGGTGPISWHV